ncbi:hypothetical protein Lal_00045168 [Lupinus albus]|nr:hypothetical protein Lal_00045168 [Lupinus albus]
MPKTTHGAQPTLKTVLQTKKVIEKCDIAISKQMIDASMPFNTTNSTYYQLMIDVICSMVLGYKGLNYNCVCGHFRSIWNKTRYTLIVYGWTDRSKQTLINFLVYCPKGTVFIKSVDASHASKTADLLFKLFKKVVMYAGNENIVDIVTNNDVNYVVAGRLLEKYFPHLFWCPCVNLKFQDIGKLPKVTDTVSHAANITKYLYNHCHLLHLMMQFTHGKEILRPTPTRFATNFIALQSILAQKDALRALVTYREWINLVYFKDVKAEKCMEQVLDSNIWKQCANIVKIIESLIHVLRIVESDDKLAMDFLYQAFFKARHEMERRFQRNKTKIKSYLEIMDIRWNLQLKINLHAAAVEEFEKHKFTTSDLLNVSEKHAHCDPDLLDNCLSYLVIVFNGDLRSMLVNGIKSIVRNLWMSYTKSAKAMSGIGTYVVLPAVSGLGMYLNTSIPIKEIGWNIKNFNDLVFVRNNLRLQ